MKKLLSPLLIAVATLVAAPSAWAEAYSLEALRDMARQSHPALQAARQQLDATRAQARTAGAFPNPEVEYLQGRSRARLPGITTGQTRSWAVTQRLDYPNQRSARLDAAEAGIRAGEADLRAFELDLSTRLAQRYFELLRRQAELKAALEDRGLADEIHRRVAVRVSTGEAARYELIKADAERLNAQKAAQSAELRVTQARAALRALVGPELPAGFEISGSLEREVSVATLLELQARQASANPDLVRARAEIRRAEELLRLERARRLPDLALRVSEDRDAELRDSRVGVVLTVPLWDRRAGPVAEAAAQLARSRSLLAEQELVLSGGLESAYRQFELARTQVGALETGIVKAAEGALKVAEAAWRFGERGILDYLDAQRVYRAARNELITARYDLQLAALEIERLAATAQ